MRGIPYSFQTKQDIINTHKLAMRRQIDKDKWLHILNTFITPNKYILPILKNEGHCFYISYTELPLPAEYSNNKRVDFFIDEAAQNQFTKPIQAPEDRGYILGSNPVEPSTQSMPKEVFKTLDCDVTDLKQDYDGIYQPDVIDPDMSVNPENTTLQKSGSVLPMLKIYADIDPQLDKLEIFYGYPILEETRMTKEEILKLIKELS